MPTEIPEEYLLKPENMTAMQRSRMRRAEFQSALVHLLYGEFYDLSTSEIQEVLATALLRHIRRNVRPKNKPKAPIVAQD